MRQELAALKRVLSERFPSAAPGPTPSPTWTLAPPGTLCEFYGSPTSGKCSLALRLLRETDGPVAYIDVAHEFYPPAAAQAGLSLDRLILCRPGDEVAALRATERLLGCGWVRALVLDRGALRTPLFAPACHRLRHAARGSNARLVILSAVPCETSDTRFQVVPDGNGVRLLRRKPLGAHLLVAL